MKCPKCGMPRALNDRVCPRCKYFFDEDRFIGVDPPRGGAAGPLSSLRESRGRAWLHDLRRKRWVPFAVSIIPGLGHAISGNPRRGLVFCLLVSILVTSSVAFFSHTLGQMLFGLAVSAHAYSIFDLTPWSRSPDIRHRSLAMGLILGGLLLVYWPLLNFIANRLLRPVRTYAGAAGWLQTPPAVQILALAAFYGALIWLSVWAGRAMSSRNRDTGA